MSFSGVDLAMMELALQQAELGRGSTSPNPLVGAVVVDEAGRILSAGYHARVGGDHGEVAALAPLSGRAPGATMYVTLEPCNHVGRTGACCDALLSAGVRRVVVGIRDPNPRVRGGGVERLRAAGLQVDVGALEGACQRQNRGYLRWVTTGLPHLILKAAVSLDGKLALGAGAPTGPLWLTGAEARTRAHGLRAACDAILVGAGTVIADDPQLTVRLPDFSGRPPLRVVLDGGLRVPETARLWGEGTLLITSEASLLAHGERAGRLRDRGVVIEALPSVSAPGTEVELAQVLCLLGRREVQSVLVEGGAIVHGAFLSAGLFQEAAVFVAPLFLGDGGVPLGRGFLVAGPAAVPRLSDVTVEPLGQDVLLRGLFPKTTPAEGGADVHGTH